LPESYHIEIDRDLCMGSGVCEAFASATFEVDAETKAAVVDAAGDPGSAIREAAASCPTGAISLRPAPRAEGT
jgi:ferredoxin